MSEEKKLHGLENADQKTKKTPLKKEGHKQEKSEKGASSIAKDKHKKNNPLPFKSKKQTSKKTKKKPVSTGLPKKKKQVKTWKKVLLVLLILFAACAIAGYIYYQGCHIDISDDTYQMKEKTEVYSADNVKIGEMFTENRTYITIDQVPDTLKNALVAVEDSRFYSHHGVDYLGIARAFFANLLSGSATGQGASTLTQQLARILYLPDISTETSFKESLDRKLAEISIAKQLEDKYSKDQILEMYLNEYYFGSGAYGIEEAAQTYFGKSVSEIDLAESAMLAGLPQAPSAYAPNNDFEAAKERQLAVLNRMVSKDYITQEEADAAYAEELTIMPWSAEEAFDMIDDDYEKFVDQALQQYAEYAAESVMQERGISWDDAIDYIRTDLASGGYKIYCTVNTNYQQEAQTAMTTNLDYYGLDQANGDTGAVVTMDQDGAVLAYYGGNTDINTANTPRQPGSNIKPLYYSGAIENGVVSTSTIITDEPININGYSPQNYGGTYAGDVTVGYALIHSMNVPSVQIFNLYGTQNAVDWIKTFGFTTIGDDDYNLATALGGLTNGLKPQEVAAAYNVFNNGGVYNQPYYVAKIEKTNGDLVYEKDQGGLDTHTVMSEETTDTMYDLLTKVVTQGTGGSAAQAYTTAGKTGTTDSEKDLWFTGMTGNITTSVWIGNLDNEVIGLGSYVPASIYGEYVRTLINNDQIRSINELNAQ